ncbi:protoporphyrinogen oxidase [Luteipulveratus flavus]|uniref:Coproporphyrinogen III oxidase n=1 Tax=Luteipulveratus flavus TaxID=3031728 RepID=A0ABT6CAD8_9MICO|nr:protoporphyrinogen oxidase [Luteipulveratus sp. YIM 133296]MDF8265865.1 protoporphyrinogen oxidase [Luteipulveratus sp. YIM 133296]
MAKVVVVGGGVAGLSAAWHLRTHSEHEVTVLEGSAAVGGRLRTDEVAGVQVDVGAESMLARRPEAVELLDELGVAPTHPAPGGARLWSREALVPLPAGTLMGVPSRPTDATGVLLPDEIERALDEQPLDVTGDVSVGDLVDRALGPAVVDRLVEPLLGGVYAGHARRLSAQVCVPTLLEAARHGRSLTATAAEAGARAASGPARPVFAGIEGGVGRLPQLLADALTARGGVVRTGVTVREIKRTPGGWDVVTGPVPLPEAVAADAVVVAVPARPASRLLTDVAPHAARLLGEIEYASMAVVTMAFERSALGAVPVGSGFLVPPVDGHAIKAATFSSGKWPWLSAAAADLFVLRVSLGRQGEEAVLQREDADLVRLGLADLRSALGSLPDPVDTHVQRWGGGLPQYAVGHLDRIASVQQDVARVDGLALAGAAYEGVGIPACIASGRSAAERTITRLRVRAERVGQ